MQKSESVKSIAPAFLKAQQAMHAATKDAVNPHFRSTYSDFASVIEAVKGPLNDNGIAFMQPVRTTEQGVEIETVLMHVSGEFYSDTLTVPLPKRDPQGVGSAISYGKRYGLQAMCGLPSEDDDGNAAQGDGKSQGTGRQQQPRQVRASSPGGAGADVLEDNAKFKAAVGAAFKSRGFTAAQQTEALAAWRGAHKLKSATEASLTERHELIENIDKAAFDRFKTPVAAA